MNSAECKPVFLLAGGRRSVARRGPDPLIREALRSSSTCEPSVAYVGAASGDNPVFRTMMAGMLRRAGARKVRPVPLCSSRSDPKKAMRVIEECPVVFMSGGDVEEGMRILADRGMIGFLQDQYQSGKLFVGASAGSIMLAKSWIRWEDPEIDTSAELFPCLGIAPIYCDTHDEEEWEELQALGRLAPAKSTLYGIPSGAALVVHPDGSVKALGGEIHCFAPKNSEVIRLANLTG
jgi:peptidase E